MKNFLVRKNEDKKLVAELLTRCFWLETEQNFPILAFKARKEAIEDTDEIFFALVSKQVEFKNPGAGAAR